MSFIRVLRPCDYKFLCHSIGYLDHVVINIMSFNREFGYFLPSLLLLLRLVTFQITDSFNVQGPIGLVTITYNRTCSWPTPTLQVPGTIPLARLGLCTAFTGSSLEISNSPDIINLQPLQNLTVCRRETSACRRETSACRRETPAYTSFSDWYCTRAVVSVKTTLLRTFCGLTIRGRSYG